MRSLVMIFLITLTQLLGLAALADDIRDGIEALDRKDFNRADATTAAERLYQFSNI